MQLAEKKQPRNSSIELLKIIGMVLIVLCHSLPTYGEEPLLYLENATTDIQQLVAVLFRYGGQIGNALFFVASSWFLLESERTSGQKILRMMGDTFVLSVFSLIANILCGYEMSTRVIAEHLFPVTFAHAWFITAYLLLYALHGLLNRALRSLDKNAHLLLCVMLLVLYVLVPMLVADMYWRTNFVWVLVLYVFVSYFKFHLQNTYRKRSVCVGMLSVGLISLVLSICFLNGLGLFVPFLSRQVLKWCYFVSPPVLLIVFGAFGLAKEKQFVNRTINSFSGLSLLVYLIHDCIFGVNLRIDLFARIQEKFGLDLLLLWILLYAVVMFVSSVLLSLVYRYTLQRLVHALCDRLCVWIGRAYRFFARKVLKWD